ncbi:MULTISPECIES: universal stress protein [Syntrophotalea]|nr:universal stress protein [Syntrophotalea acetylenica]MDY0261315.1 universal stress protein [Syntrophotalea acetylenica]
MLGRRTAGEVRDVLFGSVTNHALHRVRCPVLLF